MGISGQQPQRMIITITTQRTHVSKPIDDFYFLIEKKNNNTESVCHMLHIVIQS